MRTSLQPTPSGETLQEQRDRWLKENRGALAKIASDLGVSHGKVRLHYIGAIRTVDHNVISALAEIGAPGFAKQ